MIGGNFQTSNRGIESDNLENNFVNNSWCVTDINLTRVPFRYNEFNYFLDKFSKLFLILNSAIKSFCYFAIFLIFRVLLNSGNWKRDTTLRVECLYSTADCCRNVRLHSEQEVGPASRYQDDLLGNYTATNLQNGRFFYTLDLGKSKYKLP